MATVPPADRTSPSLDPRYDPLFQRGYAAAPERTVQARKVASAAAPAAAPRAEPRPEAAPGAEPLMEVQGTAADAPAPRPRTGILWLVSAALVVAGVFLHFAFGAAGYGADWSVSTEGGAIRFADGRSVEQVLATQLAVSVAPYLVVLGIATAVATLFVQILRSERGPR
ncbi:hypothetical protein [Naasia sp. SYSU D00948]|uniref:hypothetical protein n=1 Tax=Naasia sp. SYSU D00948 TaxID=2817379 RepID=UPI001B3075AE|nr:hypothetical protein [Naasia sp. SYSU D00948]